MLKIENLALAALTLLGASVPLAAYTGYYAPSCDWAMVWNYQYVCF